MKRISISNLIAAASNLGVYTEKLASTTKGMSGRGMVRLELDHQIAIVWQGLCYIIDVANWLELRATISAAKRLQSSLEKLRKAQGLIDSSLSNRIVSEAHQVSNSLTDELEEYLAYMVAPNEGKYISDSIGLFGLEIVEKLPSIRSDVSDGAKCRAYELWTASVMHMMRVTEVGVRALADYLEVPTGNSWGVTIQNVLQHLNSERRSKIDPELRQWASETASYLNFVKDAFRNPGMHPEVSFDRDQAISIHENTRAFMRKLVQRISSPRP